MNHHDIEYSNNHCPLIYHFTSVCFDDALVSSADDLQEPLRCHQKTFLESNLSCQTTYVYQVRAEWSPHQALIRRKFPGLWVYWQHARRNGYTVGCRVESRCIFLIKKLYHRALKSIEIKSIKIFHVTSSLPPYKPKEQVEPVAIQLHTEVKW